MGAGTVGASVWWFMFYSEGPQLNWYHLTHHLQCSTDKENFVGVPCDIFDDPHHMTMALSVLVIPTFIRLERAAAMKKDPAA